jgi:hypothetical protein
MPKIKNYTFPEGNYRTPDGMIGALQAEFESDVYGRNWTEYRYPATPEFLGCSVQSRALARIQDKTAKSLFEIAALGNFQRLYDDIQWFKGYLHHNQGGTSYLLNTQYAGDEIFSHDYNVNREKVGEKQICNYDGNTLLHFALNIAAGLAPVTHEHIFWMAAYLLQSGIDPNIKNAQGETVIHSAAWEYAGLAYAAGKVADGKMVPMSLVPHFYKVIFGQIQTLKDQYGFKDEMAAYEHLAWCGNAVIGMLLHYGCDWNAKDNHGRTVTDVWNEIYTEVHAMHPDLKSRTSGIRFSKDECLKCYEEFLLKAEESVSKIMDEKYFKTVAAQDMPTWLSESGVVEKEKDFIQNPQKRSELINARTPEAGAVEHSPNASGNRHAAQESQRRLEARQQGVCCMMM